MNKQKINDKDRGQKTVQKKCEMKMRIQKKSRKMKKVKYYSI